MNNPFRFRNDNYKKELEEKYLGKTIKIINMKGEPKYSGKVGKVEHIDGICQLHGTWGGVAVIPSEDEIEIIEETE